MIEPKSQVKKCSAHAEILQQNDERTVYRLRETDGEVRITAYPVFPGIELAYHDVHAPSYRLAEPNAAGLIEIQHCREGRAEYCCGGEHYFLAPGDLSVVRRAAIEGEVEFPTGHYHGITVTLDPALAPDCLSCILQDVDVRPSVLAEKFFADSECFVSRSSARVEHIFSELYAVPAGMSPRAPTARRATRCLQARRTTSRSRRSRRSLARRPRSSPRAFAACTA